MEPKPAHEPLCNVLAHIASQSPDNAERVKQIIASLQAQLDRMTNHD